MIPKEWENQIEPLLKTGYKVQQFTDNCLLGGIPLNNKNTSINLYSDGFLIEAKDDKFMVSFASDGQQTIHRFASTITEAVNIIINKELNI
jgi:hypothetical protein